MRIDNSTRGRIVALLRSGAKTVDELATDLKVTDNAIRAQLQVLETEQLVQPAGSRRSGGAGKPPRLYELTTEAEARLSKAFAPFLDAVLTSAGEQLGPEQVDQLLHAVGVRLARQNPAPAGSNRIDHALHVVHELGGAATATRQGKVTTIASTSCVLGAVASHHPAACGGMRAMLEEMTGKSVEERCERGERSKCRFVVRES